MHCAQELVDLAWNIAWKRLDALGQKMTVRTHLPMANIMRGSIVCLDRGG